MTRRTAAGLAVVLALLAAACGGGGSESQGLISTPSVPETQEAASSTASAPAITSVASEDWVVGKNRYETTVEGVGREYVVHVPKGYDPTVPVPVVYMLHPASGSGDQASRITGWSDVGDTENVLTVFPSSLEYCITMASGRQKQNTIWNSYTLGNGTEFCPGTDLRDDVAFLEQVMDEVEATFSVDRSRVYMVGFSSGARMVFRSAVEIGDRIAAVVIASGTETIGEQVFDAVHDLPVFFQLGNEDPQWFPTGKGGVPLDLFERSLTEFPPVRLAVERIQQTFAFGTEYVLGGDGKTSVSATYPGLDDPDRPFVFTVIEGLDHSYPNGVNHPINGAVRHWDWLEQWTLP